jgi:hypothetical protein
MSAVGVALADGPVEKETSAASESGAGIWEMTRVGDGANPPLVFSGFGPAAVVAASYSLDSSNAPVWLDGDDGRCKVAIAGRFAAELRTVPADWPALRPRFPPLGPWDQTTVRPLMWNGVSAWLADITLAPAARRETSALRQRFLVAPLDRGFLVLAFRGPVESFEASRAAMRRVARAIRFRAHGLVAEYYDGSNDLEGTPRVHVDPAIDFDWDRGSPFNGVGPEHFSIRWTGRLRPRFSETYTFVTLSDDGVRLWINGQLIVENWSLHPVTENSGQIALTTNEDADVRMEWFENQGYAVARLLWESPSQPREVVPMSCLSAEAPPGFAPPPEYGGGEIGTPEAWPSLMPGAVPGGYTVGGAPGIRWQGEPPSQGLVIGEGTNSVQVSLQKVRVAPAHADTLLPAPQPKDRWDLRVVAWHYTDSGPGSSKESTAGSDLYASAWSVDCVLDAGSHPETPWLYRQYYLVPLKSGLLVLAFESRCPAWRTIHREAFRAVFSSVGLSAEEREEGGAEPGSSLF